MEPEASEKWPGAERSSLPPCGGGRQPSLKGCQQSRRIRPLTGLSWTDRTYHSIIYTIYDYYLCCFDRRLYSWTDMKPLPAALPCRPKRLRAVPWSRLSFTLHVFLQMERQ